MVSKWRLRRWVTTTPAARLLTLSAKYPGQPLCQSEMSSRRGRSTPDQLHRALVIAEVDIAVRRCGLAAFDLGAQRQCVVEALEVEPGVGGETEAGVHEKLVGALRLLA